MCKTHNSKLKFDQWIHRALLFLNSTRLWTTTSFLNVLIWKKSVLIGRMLIWIIEVCYPFIRAPFKTDRRLTQVFIPTSALTVKWCTSLLLKHRMDNCHLYWQCLSTVKFGARKPLLGLRRWLSLFVPKEVSPLILYVPKSFHCQGLVIEPHFLRLCQFVWLNSMVIYMISF
jgi:hypothetical protein